MEDKAILLIVHMLYGALGTTGIGAVILTWTLKKKKIQVSQGNSLGAAKSDIYRLLEEHTAEDSKNFAELVKQSTDRHLEVLGKIHEVDKNVGILLDRSDKE